MKLLQEVSLHQEQAGGEFVGSIIMWNLNEVRIEQSAFGVLALNEGLPVKYLPKPISQLKAFTAAVNAAKKELADGLMLRPLGNTDKELKLALVEELRDGDNEVYATSHLATIRFDKFAHTIEASNPHPIVASLKTWFDHFQEYTLKDIKVLLTAFTSECGVPLRNSGGIYFVPAYYQSYVEAIDRLIRKLHPANQVIFLKQFDTPHNNKELLDSAMERLQAEVQELEAELADRIDSDGNTHDGTLKRRLIAYEQLKSRTLVFAKTLSFNSKTLIDRINNCQELVRCKLLGIDEFKPFDVEQDTPDTSTSEQVAPTDTAPDTTLPEVPEVTQTQKELKPLEFDPPRPAKLPITLADIPQEEHISF